MLMNVWGNKYNKKSLKIIQITYQRKAKHGIENGPCKDL